MNKKSIYTPISVYPTLLYYLSRIRLILISALIISCHGKENKEEVSKDKFQWEPGISAPKYYPIGGVKVNFGNAGNSSLTNFDNGWGNQYGSVVGEKYKDVPKEVYIEYCSAENNLVYKGNVKLNQQKIKNLFEKYDIKNHFGYLVVGMAPGGWIRVWFQTTDEKADKLVSIEVAKAHLNGYKDNTIGEGFRDKKSDYWTKYKNYWQHHGVPYEAWAENEKEYYYDVKFVSKNKEAKLDRSYVVSADGWYSSFYTEEKSDDINDNKNSGFIGKIPVHLSVSWQDKTNGQYYDTNIVMPKTLKAIFDKTYIADKKNAYNNFIIELENDKQHTTVYLKTKDKIIKLLRFKGELSSKEQQNFGDYTYAKGIEYFVK